MTNLISNALLPLSIGLGGTVLGGIALVLPRLRRSYLPAVLLLVGPLFLAAVWWQQLPAQAEHQPADYRLELRDEFAVRAVTDSGRRIRLGTPGAPVSDADLSGVEDDQIRTHALNRKVIVRTTPDPSHNCHGWVFTGGRFWVAGDDVNDILADNGYEQVSTPAVGDVAVYRTDRGAVVHSGVVAAVVGYMLVESKWGPMGRYLHGPDAQPFGGTCSYYRSARHGHVLKGLPLDGEDLSDDHDAVR
jgi:hypothetical protein